MSTVRRPWLLVVALIPGAVGCAARAGAAAPRTDEMQPGLVISLGGVGGETIGSRCLREGLKMAGAEHEFEIFHWSRGLEGLYFKDLFDLEGNRERAARLARRIEEHRRTHPDRPVFLVGESGGTGIILFALEQLADEVDVESVVLLATAVSPDYNLAPALRHVRRHLLTTYAKGDALILGWGTRTFGCMDRTYAEAAGKVGFRVPEGLSAEDRAEYAKVRQTEWTWEFLWSGHPGEHLGWNSPWFIRDYVAPVIAGRDPPSVFAPLADSRSAAGRAEEG